MRTHRLRVPTMEADSVTNRATGPQSAIASVEEIRAAFPAVRRLHPRGTVGYFDAPGGTQVPAAIAEAVSEQLLRHNANAHWEYDTSRELDEMLAASRRALADFLGARQSLPGGALEGRRDRQCQEAPDARPR